MPSGSSSSSSSDAYSSESSSSSSSGSGRSIVGEISLSDKVVIALEAFQASMNGVEVSSSRCPHGLGYTTLRVDFLGTKHLARPSLLLRGCS